ncbi:MAG: S-layer homology domain-containing protein [Chloroflexota bacterium]|nr:S-layer homology domain-containing protein [Chloroflexota bacterium]
MSDIIRRDLVAPNGFLFSATDPAGRPVDFGAYRSGAPLTLRVTATAKAGASIAGYDGAGFGVGLSSNDRAPLARQAVPSAGSAVFADVSFVKLGGQPGSPFTPRLVAADGLLPDSTGSQTLVVAPAAFSATTASGTVRSGAPFDLTVVADASGGAPEDRADYAGAVTLAAPDDPWASLPATAIFAPGGGAAVVPVTLRSLGLQRLTVRETAGDAAVTVSLTVSPLALAFVSGPVAARPGDTAYYTIAPVADGAGNTTGYTGTVTLTATGAGATIAPPATRDCAPDCAFAVSFPEAGAVTLGATDASDPPAVAPARTVAVSLPSALSAAPANLAFSATVGGDAPAAQTLSVGHTGGDPLAWSAAVDTAGGGSWLRIEAASGTTPAAVSVSVVPAGLNSGTYTGTITIAGVDAVNGPQVVGVTLTVVRQTFALTLGASPPGGGTVTDEPGSSPYRPGTVVTLRPHPARDWIFTGWTVDGVEAGWGTPLTLTMGADHRVTARFAPRPAFTDLAARHPSSDAVTQLAARGVIRGYGDGRFGPDDIALRAQMAALICRGMGWDEEDRGTPFTDRGQVDADLWRNVGALAFRGVARGYGDGTYRPTSEVLQSQVISFITRAMIAKGYWTAQPDDPALYPNVPAASGHRQDLATFVRYAGALPGTAANGAWADWDRAATRGWFARVLWQALNSHFTTDTAP